MAQKIVHPSKKQRTSAWRPYSGESLSPGGLQLSDSQQDEAIACLEKAYDGHYSDEFLINLPANDEAIFQSHLLREADTYGELLPLGLLDILWRIGARPGARFYDLGSGPGKLAAMAWMVGLHATGVELSRLRWEGSCSAIVAIQELNNSCSLPPWRGLENRENIRLDSLCADALEVDFMDADILLANTEVFPGELVRGINEIARWMKPGSKIISCHDFEGPEFRQLGVVIQPTTWSDGHKFVITEVVKNPPQPCAKPCKLKSYDSFDVSSRCSLSSAPPGFDKEICDIWSESMQAWRTKCRRGAGIIDK